MTSTGCCRDQDAVIRQVGRDKTVKALEDDHGKLELYSLSDGQWRLCSPLQCDVVELSCASHNARC